MINAYAVDPIIILQWNGYDEWNEPLSGTVVEVKGYVEYRTRLVRDIKGEERVSSVTVKMPKKIDVELGRPLSHEDRLIVGEESIERSIISIGQPKAFSGPHYEVALA